MCKFCKRKCDKKKGNNHDENSKDHSCETTHYIRGNNNIFLNKLAILSMIYYNKNIIKNPIIFSRNEWNKVWHMLIK